MDLSKAFDTINHSLLLVKTESICFFDQALSLLQSLIYVTSNIFKGYRSHFSAQAQKIKETNLKKFLIFSQIKASPIFWEMGLFKRSSYISGGNLKRLKK